jgi:serine/threonine-protein kinase
MGTVYAAVHEGLGRTVAVKVLKRGYTTSSAVVARFQNEAEAVTRIGHPHIVAIYDFGQLPDGGLFYVMEKIEGETLTARLRRLPLSETEIRDVFTQLLSALAAAHNVSVVHRDLKPDNILLAGGDGAPLHVKLCDFGVAKIRDDRRTGPLTAVGALMGTPRYMAPEQITGAQDVDGRADIYAVGVMLYEALCGAPPFTGPMMALLHAHINQAPTPPSERAAQPGAVPRPSLRWDLLDPVVLRALAKKPEDRYQDCRSLALDLEAALTPSLPKSAPPAASVAAPTPAAAPAPPQGRSAAFFLACAASILLLVGLGALLLRALRGPAEPAPPAEEVLAIQQTERQPEVQERAKKVLLEALGGPPDTRRAALSAVSAVSPPGGAGGASPALLAALAEAAEGASGAAAIEIAAVRLTLGQTAAADDLATLARRAPDPVLRLRATLALVRAGHAPAERLRAALAAAGRDLPQPLRAEAEALLATAAPDAGAPPTGPLVPAPLPEDIVRLFSQLRAQATRAQARAALTQFLTDPRPDAAAAAAVALLASPQRSTP